MKRILFISLSLAASSFAKAQDTVKVSTIPNQEAEKFFNSGVEVVGSSPETLAATIKAEITRMDKVIREAGIRVE